MADEVLNVLRANLANSEAAGLTDKVKRIEARIAELEKAPKGEAPKPAMTLTVPAPAAPAVLGATVSTTNPPNPTFKKASASKKSVARKKK